MEKGKFEEDWKNAFSGAEESPSESVWSNIDLKLENETMKKRVVFYQRLAAASIFFALVWGAITFRNNFNSDSTPVSIAQERNALPPENVTDANTTEGQSNSESLITQSKKDQSTTSAAVINNQATSDQVTKTSASDVELAAQGNVLLPAQSNNDVVASITDPESKHEERFISQSQILTSMRGYMSPKLSSKEPSNKKAEKPVDTPLYSYLPNENVVNDLPQEKKVKKEDLWLAFGGGAGSFNPSANFGAASANDQAGSVALGGTQNSVQSKPSNSGIAYSMGLSVGKKIGDRWMVQGGLAYLTQAVDYTTNGVSYSSSNSKEAFIADYADRSSATVTQPYRVNSHSEFVSFPIQAGYLLVDRKFGLQLNTGLATDVFLKNTLRDQSGTSSKYSQSSGENSPYRTFNWTALASTELSYKIAKQYRVSLMPGMRYSLAPSLKSSSLSSGNPFVLDLGFRFRYIFK